MSCESEPTGTPIPSPFAVSIATRFTLHQAISISKHTNIEFQCITIAIHSLLLLTSSQMRAPLKKIHSTDSIFITFNFDFSCLTTQIQLPTNTKINFLKSIESRDKIDIQWKNGSASLNPKSKIDLAIVSFTDDDSRMEEPRIQDTKFTDESTCNIRYERLIPINTDQ